MMNTLRFFLVDDDEEDTQLFEEVLSDCAPAVLFHSARSGKDALTALRKQASDAPHLLFLDLNMPGMDGKECLRELKSDPGLAQIPVIIYTTSSYQKDMDETRQLGAIGLITKPSDMDELERILATIVENCPHNLENAMRFLSTQVKL